MKIAILQLNSRIGDFANNVQKILGGYREACRAGADLVVAPELALCGYPPQDLLFQSTFVRAHYEALDLIIEEIGEVALILGVIQKNCDKGKPFYNSAVFIENGKIRVRQHKTLLPTYGEFDERRYFEPNRKGVKVLTYKGKRIAMLVCEDIWGNEVEQDGHKLYTDTPVHELKGAPLDIVISVNASPYYWGKGDIRLGVVSNAARTLNSSVIYVNRIGGQDELVFDGGSFAVDGSGKCIGMAKRFSEEMCIVDVGSPKTTFYESDVDIENLYGALVLGFRDYVLKSGLKGAVLGLSGGIDSAVAAAIATETLGKDKVIGLSMPSKWSSKGSEKDAEDLAVHLGIKFLSLPIGNIYDAVGRTVLKNIGWNIPGSVGGDVTEENVQARARGLIVMAFANRYNHIAVATGNKSELAVGYATLYGDMVGGFAILKDVFKTDVYSLARFLNKDKERIPQNTIEKPPSAELAPGQKDADSLPPYDILDPILKLYIEENRGVEEIVVHGYNKATVSSVTSMVDRAEHKRRQGAPGVLVTRRGLSVGAGRFWPISSSFLSI